MKEKTIVLPADLKKRRSLLEAELSAVIEAQVTANVEEELKELLNEAGFTEGTATIEWEFYSQYDDEGGYDKRATDYRVSVNGESIDLEDDYKDENGEPVYLFDYISDILGSYSTDLYDSDIYDVTVTLH